MLVNRVTVRKIPHESAYVVRGYSSGGELITSCEESDRGAAADTANAMLAAVRNRLAVNQFGEYIAAELAAVRLPSDVMLAEEFASELRYYIRLQLDSIAIGADDGAYTPRELVRYACESMVAAVDCITPEWTSRETAIVKHTAKYAAQLLASMPRC